MPKKKSHSEPPPDPRGLSVQQLAKILSAGNSRAIIPAMIERDIAEGAPVNGDGTINLIHYGAWLLKHQT